MKIELYTIPHTGTRTAHRFLKLFDVKVNQRHVASPRTVPAWRRVLTVRHPHDVYKTWKRRFPSEPDYNFVASWGHYIWRTSWQDAFYLAWDIPKDNRRWMLNELCMWCNVTPDFDIIDPFCEEWPKVGSGSTGDEVFPDYLENALKFAVEWYEHYTLYPGRRIRDAQNMIGEGP